MVTIDQVKSGISAYIDAEILPRIDGYKRYGLLVYMSLLMDNFNNTVVDLLKIPAVSVLGIVDADGRVDIDRLHNAAYQSMRDNVDITIPIVGRFIFSRSDVDKLCEMIKKA